MKCDEEMGMLEEGRGRRGRDVRVGFGGDSDIVSGGFVELVLLEILDLNSCMEI
jgi:hypothetical protein